MAGERWPRWVYGEGAEPDARFSMANERTFLAWIRTAMAFLAGGVAVDVVPLDLSPAAQRGLAALLLALGAVSAVTAWLRWARSERAMRRGEPLPAPVATGVLAVGLLVAALALVLVVVR